MPTADLRALAERLNVLQACDNPDCENPSGLGRCWRCDDTGRRMPAEAEVRAAIFEAGAGWVRVNVEPDWAEVMTGSSGGGVFGQAEADEAAPHYLVLLALLRALDEVRRLEKRS